jgi:hypothetical protein
VVLQREPVMTALCPTVHSTSRQQDRGVVHRTFVAAPIDDTCCSPPTSRDLADHQTIDMHEPWRHSCPPAMWMWSTNDTPAALRPARDDTTRHALSVCLLCPELDRAEMSSRAHGFINSVALSNRNELIRAEVLAFILKKKIGPNRNGRNSGKFGSISG